MNRADEERQRRKLEHIQAVSTLPDQGGTGFEDVRLVPVSASECDFDEVSVDVDFLGCRMAFPMIINAMTGGTVESGQINRRLAAFAARHGLAMAVGSETTALRDRKTAPSYTVVREQNPDGVLIANVGMGTRGDVAREAVGLIDADLLQVHWNTAQELFMPEGDRKFSGLLARLEDVCQAVDVPVIAKEVGQGMSGDAAQVFLAHGARAIDIGGRGGTNFIAVEAWRRGMALDEEWAAWGIPTVTSLIEVTSAVDGRVPVVASGGIRTGHDVAKSIALGAQVVGVAGPLLRLAKSDDEAALDRWFEQVAWTLRAIMVLTGCRRLTDLRSRPAVVGGITRQWLAARGYGPRLDAMAERPWRSLAEIPVESPPTTV